MEKIVKNIIYGILVFCAGVLFFILLSWPAMQIEALIYPHFTTLGISNTPHYCMNNSPEHFNKDDYIDCLDFFEKTNWMTGGIMFVITIGGFYFYEQFKSRNKH